MDVPEFHTGLVEHVRIVDHKVQRAHRHPDQIGIVKRITLLLIFHMLSLSSDPRITYLSVIYLIIFSPVKKQDLCKVMFQKRLTFLK